jgi:hypothetical protein
MQIIYNDFLINFNTGFDKAIRCRENEDFYITPQGDISLTRSAIEAVLQKVWLWMAVKYGEVPNDPELGCPIYKYFFKKATPNNFALLQREVESSLKNLIPELDVKSVSCKGAASSEGLIEDLHLVILSNTYEKFDLKTSQGDMEKLNEYYNEMREALELIDVNNR